MSIIQNQNLDQERALYGETDLTAENCRFDGPSDGESAFKECKNIRVSNCFFNLRYPFWHDTGLHLQDSELTELCRAALWYSKDISISGTQLHGIKALRECENVTLTDCSIRSAEFGWSTRNVVIMDTTAFSEYFFLRGENLTLRKTDFKGKYSFQYAKNVVIENCHLETKDAFWHGENVIVRNCVVKGEYLAWYSKHVTFENCEIVGTQPFCYCEDLKLINCKMLSADLCFEKSQVEATLLTPVDSIKNPRSGKIILPAVGEIIMDDPAAQGIIEITA